MTRAAFFICFTLGLLAISCGKDSGRIQKPSLSHETNVTAEGDAKAQKEIPEEKAEAKKESFKEGLEAQEEMSEEEPAAQKEDFQEEHEEDFQEEQEEDPSDEAMPDLPYSYNELQVHEKQKLTTGIIYNGDPSSGYRYSLVVQHAYSWAQIEIGRFTSTPGVSNKGSFTHTVKELGDEALIVIHSSQHIIDRGFNPSHLLDDESQQERQGKDASYEFLESDTLYLLGDDGEDLKFQKIAEFDTEKESYRLAYQHLGDDSVRSFLNLDPKTGGMLDKSKWTKEVVGGGGVRFKSSFGMTKIRV